MRVEADTLSVLWNEIKVENRQLWQLISRCLLPSKSGRVEGCGGSPAAAESLPDCPEGFGLLGATGCLRHEGLAAGGAIPRVLKR